MREIFAFCTAKQEARHSGASLDFGFLTAFQNSFPMHLSGDLKGWQF